MTDVSLGQLVRNYMGPHKQVTFQSMARHIGIDADFLYDIVNEKPIKKNVEKKVRAWLIEHKNDPEKIRFK